MKGRDILIGKGYRALVRRNVKPNKDDKGCGYSIYIDKNVDEAVLILKERNVKILGQGIVSDYR